MAFENAAEGQETNRIISVISFTRRGFELSLRVRVALKRSGQKRTILYTKKDSVALEFEEAVLVKEPLRDWCAGVFSCSEAIIFIGASGIAVRTIAPFLVSKKSDPAVLVADEKGNHIISLLSGHLGGGNELTLFLAGALGADPVITTASDVNEKLAVDVWAKKNHLTICDMKLAKLAAAEIVDGKRVPFCCDGGIRGEIPEELLKVDSLRGMARSEQNGEPEAGGVASCGILVSVRSGGQESEKQRNASDPVLRLVPRAVIAGIGCRKGKACEDIRRTLERVLKEYQVAPESICRIASIDLKKDEPGLLQLSQEAGIPFVTFSGEELLNVPGEYSASSFVSKITGVDNVCERAAAAALKENEKKNAHFICRKYAAEGVTIALMETGWEVVF